MIDWNNYLFTLDFMEEWIIVRRRLLTILYLVISVLEIVTKLELVENESVEWSLIGRWIFHGDVGIVGSETNLVSLEVLKLVLIFHSITGRVVEFGHTQSLIQFTSPFTSLIFDQQRLLIDSLLKIQRSRHKLVLLYSKDISISFHSPSSPPL